MKPPSLTIVIPAYNEQANIGRCLAAIGRQTVAPEQIIVVDNNSTDQTAQIARRYPLVKVIRERQQGIAYAHRAGFNAAGTGLVARIDAETVLPPDWIARVTRFYQQPGHTSTALAGSGYLYNLAAPWLTRFIMIYSFMLMRPLAGHWPMWGPNFVVPRRAWQQVEPGLCREPAFDDFDLSIHLHAAGLPIVWDPRLHVGAMLRHVDTLRDFRRYCDRWSQTLQPHSPARARWSRAVVGILVPGHYAIVKLLRR